MKIFKNILQASLAVLLLFFLGTGCNKPGALTIDPVNYDNPFTFSPVNGYPGQTVVLTSNGLDFSDVKEVSVTNTKAEVLEQTATTITIKVPVGALTGKIKLAKESTVIPSSTSFTVDGTPTPNIIDFSPAIIGSRDILTINGNLLDKVDSVYIGTLKAAIQAGTTASQLKVKTPVGLITSKVKLYFKVMTSYGMLKVTEYASATDLTLKLPVISSISPDISALNIGDVVTIKTTLADSITRVDFGTIQATPITKVDAGTITVKVPTGATTGKIKLTVFDGFTESVDNFQTVLPVITYFFPLKGPEVLAPGTRTITVNGTGMNLVNSVLVGTTTATINDRSATGISFTVSGTTSGVISLVTTNGSVKSATPFIITGDFWVVNYDNTYTPSRYVNTVLQNAGSGTTTVTAGGPTGSYARVLGVTKAAGNRIRSDIQSTDAGGFTVPDAFLLYASDPKGVYFSFDINIKNIPPAMLDSKTPGDTTLTFQVYAFSTRVGSAAPNPPYGFSTMITVPFVRNSTTWRNVSVQLSDLKEDTGLDDGTTPANHTANRARPDRLRIMAFILSKDQTLAPVGSLMEWNIDNAKFTIQ